MMKRSAFASVLGLCLSVAALAAAGDCAEELPPSLCGVGECGVDGRGGYCNVCVSMVPYATGA